MNILTKWAFSDVDIVEEYKDQIVTEKGTFDIAKIYLKSQKVLYGKQYEPKNGIGNLQDANGNSLFSITLNPQEGWEVYGNKPLD